jgi:enoyl-CoA hydratase/carnithine racemase
VDELTVEPLERLRAGLPGRRVLLDAPRRRNALSPAMVEQLHRLFAGTPDDPVVLGSTSPGIFSAGADLTVDDATRARLSDRLYELYAVMVGRPGPVVAVVEGPAVGGGAQLTTAADLRVASPAARWRWAGPGHGLAVGAWIVPELVGRARGLELTLTGRWLSADEALAAGLVASVDHDPWGAAAELVGRLARADRAALARVKQVATTPALLERLATERWANRDSWSGAAPGPREAAAEHRSLDDPR